MPPHGDQSERGANCSVLQFGDEALGEGDFWRTRAIGCLDTSPSCTAMDSNASCPDRVACKAGYVQKERHAFYSFGFRESVRCLLLCHKRLEKGMPRCAELGVKRGRERSHFSLLCFYLISVPSAFAPASDESTAVTSRTSCTSFPSPNLGDIPSLLVTLLHPTDVTGSGCCA